MWGVKERALKSFLILSFYSLFPLSLLPGEEESDLDRIALREIHDCREAGFV